MDAEQLLHAQIMKDAADALKIAKITLMMQKNTVFYTTILFSLKQAITDEIPTACTNGRDLLINPTFFTDLTANERLTLLSHEVLHVALDHMHRIGNRNPQLWNIAADYVINGSLVKAGYTLPKGGLYDIKYDGKTTEEVYRLLDKEPEQVKAGLSGKCPAGSLNGNDIAYPDKNDPDNSVSQNEVTEIILRASTQARMMGQDPGSVPGEISIELTKTLNPPLPWNVILQNYMTEFSNDDYTFRRPNKRFLPKHYLPVAYTEAMTNVAVAVDASSSVNDHEFNIFINKISDILRTVRPKKITVIAFDTRIQSVQELTVTDDPFKKLKFKGRGGTAIEPVHIWAAENKPTVMLIFTDGEFKQVQPINKAIPLIWLIHDAPTWKTPYGRVIHYNTTKP